MKITQQDVGRQVALRNGRTEKIVRWDDSDTSWPVQLSDMRWYDDEGKYDKDCDNEIDIVVFVVQQENVFYLLGQLVASDDRGTRNSLGQAILELL